MTEAPGSQSAPTTIIECRIAPLTHAEKIQILMAEYNTLRAEVIQKSNSTFQIFGVAITAVVAISGIVATYAIIAGFSIFIILIVVLLATYRSIEFSMLTFGNRLREIEREVNQLAGAKLLKWETEYVGILPN